MDLTSYSVPSAILAQEYGDAAEAALADADVASGDATRFVLLAVLFALVLLVFTAVRLTLLPQLL